MSNIKHFYAALKTAADAALWLGVVSAVFGAYIGFSNLFPTVIILGFSVGAASFLCEKNEKLRFIALIIAVCPFLLCHSTFDILITVPIVAYTEFIIVKKFLTAEYIVLNEIFPKVIFFVALAGFFHAYRGVSWGFMCVLVYTVFTIYLLRVLRYGDSGSTGKLPLLEIGTLAALVLLCFFFSSKAFLSFGGTVGGVLYDYIVTPIISLVFLIIYGGIWVVFKIALLFVSENENVHMVNFANSVNGLSEDMIENVKEQNGGAHMAVIALKIAAVLIFFLIAAFFFKRLMETMSARKISETQYSEAKVFDEETLPQNDKPKFSDRSPSAKVRRYYASFCRAAAKAGVSIFPGDTSRDVCESTEKYVDSELGSELRGYYIRARYGDESTLTAAEIKRAHEISKKLKSQLKKE